MPRTLFQILGPRGDELHAAVVGWLLDPNGEHGRGEEFVLRLGAFLNQHQVEWPGTEAAVNQITTAPRVRHGVYEVARTCAGTF